MKIWLDSFSFHYSHDGYLIDTKNADEYIDECDDCADCIDDCSVYDISAYLSLGQEHLFYRTGHHFQLARTLYIQAYDASHWLICNPVEGGNIAVLDGEAFSLLENFRVPMTLQEVCSTENWPLSRLLHTVSLFIALCFLSDLDCTPVAHEGQPGLSALTAWLHITNACNLRCSYCYISKSSEHMEKDTSRRAVDAVMRSALRHGYRHVQLKYAGGEAMLQLPEVIATHDYALQQAQERNLRLSAGLLSNGTIMTQRMIEQLKERHMHIMISLDGIGAVHDQQRPFLKGSRGSFALVDRTISCLLANDMRPSINVTVSQRNIAHLPALLSYILERDLHFTLSYYRENDCSASIADLQFSEKQMIDGMRVAFASIEQQLPKKRIVDSLIDKGNIKAPHHYTCGIGRNYLVINQRGDVVKCQADMAHIVTTIQADDPLQEIRSERSGMQAIDVDQKEGCRTCTWRYWCGGGCPLVTYRMAGRNDLRSPNCSIYKALFPEAVRLEALRLLTYEAPISL